MNVVRITENYYKLILHKKIFSVLTDESEKLQEEYKKQPCHLERLYGWNST